MSPSDSDDGARLHIGEIATVSEGVVTKFDVFEAYALRYENMVDECAEISPVAYRHACSVMARREDDFRSLYDLAEHAKEHKLEHDDTFRTFKEDELPHTDSKACWIYVAPHVFFGWRATLELVLRVCVLISNLWDDLKAVCGKSVPFGYLREEITQLEAMASKVDVVLDNYLDDVTVASANEISTLIMSALVIKNQMCSHA